MTALLWGRVYFQNVFSGELREIPGGRSQFLYDESYLNENHPQIAYTLPLQKAPITSEHQLPAFFDNLVAEGWLAAAQTRLLGKRHASRFELLLAFGQDCAGAVSVIDPTLEALTPALMDLDDPKEVSLLTSRASLSGIQPKISLIKEGNIFRPAKGGELSTYIAKFPSQNHADLIFNEYLTMQAFQALLPTDSVADVDICDIEGFDQPALIVKRFDRQESRTVHFEEFNQLLNHPSELKYEESYKNMADFMLAANGLPIEIYRLYQRVIAGILLGNTDMHLKNFAMLHTSEGLRLAPSYDQVAAVLYDYKTVALELAGVKNFHIGKLNARHIIRLGREFNLTDAMIEMAINQLKSRLDVADAVIQKSEFVTQKLKDNLTKIVRKRWNGTFASIGKHLLQKR